MSERPTRAAERREARLPAGDEESLRLSRHLRELARRLVDDEASADDVVQEAWLAALDRPERVHDLNAWLSQVVRNLSARLHRRRLRRADVEALAAEGEAVDPETEIAERVSASKLLREAIDGLPAKHRDAIELRFFQELPLERVAAELGLSTEAARSRVRRAVGALRAELDRRAGGRRTVWAGLFASALQRGPGRWVPRPTPLGAVAALTIVAGSLMLAWTAWRPDAGGAVDSGTNASTSPDERPASTERSELPASERVAVAPPVPAAPIPASPVGGAWTLELRVRLQDGGRPRSALAQVWTERGFRAALRAEDGQPMTVRVPLEQLDPPGLLPGGEPSLHLWARADDEAISWTHLVPMSEPGRALEVRTRGPAMTVEGHVLDEDGAPVAGARVVRDDPRTGGSSPSEQDTFVTEPVLWKSSDAEGRYRLSGLPIGEHVLRVTRSGFRETQASAAPPEGAAAGEVVALDLVLRRGLGVEGTLRLPDGAPAEGARVWWPGLERDRGRAPVEARADARGGFLLEGLEPGRRHVFAHAREDPALFACALVEVGAEEDARWDARLAPTTGVHVLVEEEDGAPVEGAYVVLISEAGEEGWAALVQTDADGHAHVAHAPDGELTGIVRRHGADEEQEVVEGVLRDEPDVYVTLRPEGARGSIVATAPRRILGRAEAPELFGERGVEQRFDLEPEPAAGRFEAGALRPGSYRLWLRVPERGVVPLGEHEVGAAALDLGLLAVPEPVRVELDWKHATPDARRPWVLEALNESLLSPAARIALLTTARGELELYPGRYALRPLESGAEPRLFVLGSDPLRVEL